MNRIMKMMMKTGDEKMVKKNKRDLKKQAVRVIALAVALIMVALVIFEFLAH